MLAIKAGEPGWDATWNVCFGVMLLLLASGLAWLWRDSRKSKLQREATRHGFK